MGNRTRQNEVTEKELMEALARAPDTADPDPCLSAESLQLLADGRLEGEAERLRALTHFATCHHCVSALAELRRESQRRSLDQRRRPTSRLIAVFAVAAILLIAAALWIVQRPFGRSNASNDAAIADLRNDVTRGVDNPPIRVTRATKHLKIILPLGSAVGKYDVEMLGPEGRTILHSSALSSVSIANPELLLDYDFRSVIPGRYSLAIRHGHSQWEIHQMFVE